MVIGKGHRLSRVEGVNWVDRLKIFGITYRNSRDPVDKDIWGEILREVQGDIEKFKYFTTSIFGRANIVNTLIQPKLLYIAHVDTPTKKIITQYNKMVRTFIFKGTLPKIKHSTLIQEKIKGGVNLHDLELKIKSLRLKNLIKLKNKKINNPIQHYYISKHMRQHIKFNNARPHFFGTLPPFYKHAMDTYRKHASLVDINPNKIYSTLVAAQLEPLDRQIKRLGIGQPVGDIFKDLHTNPNFTHTQKNTF